MRRLTVGHWWWISWIMLAAFFATVVLTLVFIPAAILDKGNQLAGILGSLVGVVSLVVSVVAARIASRYVAYGTHGGADLMLDRAAARLAELVRRQWQHEAATRLLLSPQPIRVRWSSTGRTVSATPDEILGPAVATGRALRLRLAGDVTQVVDTFSRLPARQLVVIGEPGAGKSVLAMLLTLGLLDMRSADDAVPVLLTASSWIPREPLGQWVTRRVSEDYAALRNDPAIGPSGLARLVETGKILPIIDGIDEIDARFHAAVINGLNAFASMGRAFVLTCRSAEFETAVAVSGTPLARAAVVELQPVTQAQASTYLSAGQIDGKRRWAQAINAVNDNPYGALAGALSTPLMVYLARTVYTSSGTDPGELCQSATFATTADIEQHLLRSYLPALYPPSVPAATSAYPHYLAAQAIQWLAFLARHLQHQGKRDLAWWELPEAVPRWRRIAAGYGAVSCAAACSVPVAFAAGLPSGFAAAAAGAVAGATLVGLTVERGSRRILRLPHSGWQRGFMRAVRYGLMIGLPSILLAGTTLAAIGSDQLIVTTSLIIGLGLGCITGLIAGRVRGKPPQAKDPSTITPRSVIRTDRRDTIITIGSVVVASCLATAITFRLTWQAGGTTADVAVAVGTTGLLAGTAAGVVISLVANARSSWLSYTAARCYLAAQGKLPWRFMRFLDDAHRRGILRQAGNTYQFRHARLQDHLAANSNAHSRV